MVWGPRSTYRTPDSRRKILKNLSKNFEKLLGNDLPGHLQSSEFAYAEVQGWQTFPQWSRGPIIWIFHSFLDPKIYKKFGAPPVEGTFILIPIDPFKSDQSAGAPKGFEFSSKKRLTQSTQKRGWAPLNPNPRECLCQQKIDQNDSP